MIGQEGSGYGRARVQDAQDFHAVRFPPVDDDVVFEHQFADVGRPPSGRAPDFRRHADAFECLQGECPICVFLADSLHAKRAAEDVKDIAFGPGQYDDLNI